MISTVVGWKAAGAAAKKVPAAPAKYIKVADMDNDGYLDIVVAGGMVSHALDESKVYIYFGSEATKASGDYSAARWVKVGQQNPYTTGSVLVIDLADVDGDGLMDVAVSYDGNPRTSWRTGIARVDGFDSSKRVYFGKEKFTEADHACSDTPAGDRDEWLSAEARLFGPSSQEAWRITSLELVDLNLDGNLDVLYARDASNSPVGRAYVALGTTNSECRSPGDDFYPVETRIDIDFPVIPCTKEDFKDCILLDPITALSSTVDTAANQGVIMCSYVVDLHRDAIKRPPSPPPPSPPPPTPPPPTPPPPSPPPPPPPPPPSPPPSPPPPSPPAPSPPPSPPPPSP